MFSWQTSIHTTFLSRAQYQKAKKRVIYLFPTKDVRSSYTVIHTESDKLSIFAQLTASSYLSPQQVRFRWNFIVTKPRNAIKALWKNPLGPDSLQLTTSII